MSEYRLDHIELKLTSQEDLLDTLNMQIYTMQKKIDALEMLCAALAKQSREGLANQNSLPHERPPHY